MSVRSLFESQDIQYEVKEVKVSFGTIYVKKVPYSVIRDLMKVKEDRDVLLETIRICLCESDGTPCFKEGEEHLIACRPAEQLVEIEAAAVEFNTPKNKVGSEKKG